MSWHLKIVKVGHPNCASHESTLSLSGKVQNANSAQLKCFFAASCKWTSRHSCTSMVVHCHLLDTKQGKDIDIVEIGTYRTKHPARLWSFASWHLREKNDLIIFKHWERVSGDGFCQCVKIPHFTLSENELLNG